MGAKSKPNLFNFFLFVTGALIVAFVVFWVMLHFQLPWVTKIVHKYSSGNRQPIDFVVKFSSPTPNSFSSLQSDQNSQRLLLNMFPVFKSPPNVNELGLNENRLRLLKASPFVRILTFRIILTQNNLTKHEQLLGNSNPIEPLIHFRPIMSKSSTPKQNEMKDNKINQKDGDLQKLEVSTKTSNKII